MPQPLPRSRPTLLPTSSQTLDSRPAVESLCEQWRSMAETGPFSAPFFQPEWCLAGLEAFFPKSQPHFVAVQHDGDKRLLGVLPLIRSNTLRKGMPLRSLVGPVSTHSCRADFVARASDVSLAAQGAWEALKADNWWQAVRMDDVLEGGAFQAVMRLAKEDGYLTATWRTRLSPTLPVAGPDPFAACPKRYKSFRNRLKGKLARLSEQGEVSFQTETHPTTATLERFFALEASGWKGAKGSAVASATQTRRFYTDVFLDASQRGYARSYTMWMGSKPIAMQFGMLRDGVYYNPKVAYDETYRDFSLGHIMMGHVIQDISAAGASRFDFLGPNALWKSVWSTSLQRHDNCFIFRPTLAGRAAHAGLIQVGLRLRALRHRFYGDPQDLEKRK